MKKVMPPRFQKYSFYIISSLVFFVWLCFFDRSNLYTQFKIALDLKKLETQKNYFENELKVIKKEELQILGSNSALEKFAREKYLMKKEGETVFVIVDENEKPLIEKDQ